MHESERRRTAGGCLMASPFCFRPSPELAERIEEDARVRGLKRAQWLTWAVEQALGEGLSTGEAVADARPSALARASVPADGSSRADAFRAASLRRLGR